MVGRPGRPRGHTILAGASVTAAVILLPGCSDGSADLDRDRTPPASSLSAVSAVSDPSPSRNDVRTLKEGQTLPVAISPNDLFDTPASSAEVTLTALKQADVLPQGVLAPETADPGMTYVCLEFKVKNTSNEEFDTSHLTEARWTGKDGETRSADHKIGGNCGKLGLVEENLLTEPDPRPGEFVQGTTVLMVPDNQPGTLEFADVLDHPMFKVETTRSR